jgi:LysM repeat protein
MPGLSRIALLAGAVAIAAIALFMLPAFLGVGGNGPASSASPTASTPIVATSPSPTIAAAPTQQVYIIKSKDTLSKVAKAFGITLEELLAANPEITNPDRISLGQQIVIPAPGSGPSTPPGSAAP